MKTFLIVLLAILIGLGILLISQYPKLKLISGFVAKNAASSYFIAHRSLTQTHVTEHSQGLIRFANTQLFPSQKMVIASVGKLSPKKAFYKDGIGCVLINNNENHLNFKLKPNRNLFFINKPYPYGHLAPTPNKFNNIDYTTLEKIGNQLFEKNNLYQLENTRSFLILYDGQLIFEKYQDGYHQKSLFQGWSITKSLMATCFGVLMKNGYTLEKPLTCFSEWQQDARKKITTKHLLHMESGLAWEEDYTKISDVTQMLFEDTNVTQRALHKKLIHPPGTFFNYASGSSNLLSAILRKQFKNHQAYLDFPYQSIFDKIGMNSLLIETDTDGNYVNSSYSWATTRDWAKFGQLMLDNGIWNGETIVDPKWIDFIRTPNLSSKGEYGGHWWLNKGNFMKKIPNDIFYADGYQGQRIFVVPSKKLVIVRFGVSNNQREAFYDTFNNLISDVIKTINYKK